MDKSSGKIQKLDLKKRCEFKGLNREKLDAVGIDFAKKLKGSDIVLFFGDLGSGKTTFIRSVLSFFRIPEHEVRSPTFNIVNTYTSDELVFYHIDAYRISAEELFEIGFYDYQNENSVIFVEWAEKIIDELDEADYLLELSIDEENIEKRNLIIYTKE